MACTALIAAHSIASGFCHTSPYDCTHGPELLSRLQLDKWEDCRDGRQLTDGTRGYSGEVQIRLPAVSEAQIINVKHPDRMETALIV